MSWTILAAVVLFTVASACSGGNGGKTEEVGGNPPGSSTAGPSTIASTPTTAASSASTVPGPPGQGEPTGLTPDDAPPLQGPPPTAGPDTSSTDYPEGGPVDNVIPPNVDAYALLRQGKCSRLINYINNGGPDEAAGPWEDSVDSLDVVYLYRAAAEACLSLWESAERDFGLIGNPDFSGSCGGNVALAECQRARQAVHEWTSELLAAHEADPSFVPRFPYPPS